MPCSAFQRRIVSSPSRFSHTRARNFSGSPRLASRGVRFVLAGIEVLGRVAEPDHSGLIYGLTRGLAVSAHRGTALLSGSMCSVCEKRELLIWRAWPSGTAPQRHGGVDQSSPQPLPASVELGHRVYSHRASPLDTARAARELTSLFEHQWRNGKVPHIVFNPDAPPGRLLPGPRALVQCGVFPGSPPAPPHTSCLCQPPTHALGALRVWELAQERDQADVARGFLSEIYPKLLAWHRYLATERDPEGSGLVTINHPWESGTDNSPRWDGALQNVEAGDLPPFERQDLDDVDHPTERPTDEEYASLPLASRAHKARPLRRGGIIRIAPVPGKGRALQRHPGRGQRDLAEIAG